MGSFICVTNEEHRFFVQELLSQEPSLSSSNNTLILLEPVGRNTAAAMGAAALIPYIEPSDLLLFLLEENQSTYVPTSVKHRLENPGNTDLEMTEVQSGGYLGEDDIVHFEDTYGRS